MTRDELQAIKKPQTGLTNYVGNADESGYCTVTIGMQLKRASLHTIRDVHDAFRAYLRRRAIPKSPTAATSNARLETHWPLISKG